MRAKEVSWWIFYILFLLIVLFLFTLLFRGLIGGAIGKASNVGQLVYFIGLMMAVFGLLAMCVVYVLGVMRQRLRSHQNRANRGGLGEKSQRRLDTTGIEETSGRGD